MQSVSALIIWLSYTLALANTVLFRV